MATWGYCSRGGQQGFRVTTKELKAYARSLGNTFIDEAIPLETTDPFCEDHSDTVYWETEKGSHGWCCCHCGLVTQWG